MAVIVYFQFMSIFIFAAEILEIICLYKFLIFVEFLFLFKIFI
jgi:hypothetical protein